jgi:hypothetical protein
MGIKHDRVGGVGELVGSSKVGTVYHDFGPDDNQL